MTAITFDTLAFIQPILAQTGTAKVAIGYTITILGIILGILVVCLTRCPVRVRRG